MHDTLIPRGIIMYPLENRLGILRSPSAHAPRHQPSGSNEPFHLGYKSRRPSADQSSTATDPPRSPPCSTHQPPTRHAQYGAHRNLLGKLANHAREVLLLDVALDEFLCEARGCFARQCEDHQAGREPIETVDALNGRYQKVGKVDGSGGRTVCGDSQV